MTEVEQLLKDDRRSLAEFPADTGPALLRYRTPVLGPDETGSHPLLLIIAWAYGEEGSRELPDSAITAELGSFEDHLCDAVQRDTLAILTAVLTFDGARQWVFYSRDTAEFARRLSVIPDYHGQRYPIELTTQEDATWSYLREQIVQQVHPDAG